CFTRLPAICTQPSVLMLVELYGTCRLNLLAQVFLQGLFSNAFQVGVDSAQILLSIVLPKELLQLTPGHDSRSRLYTVNTGDRVVHLLAAHPEPPLDTNVPSPSLRSSWRLANRDVGKACGDHLK